MFRVKGELILLKKVKKVFCSILKTKYINLLSDALGIHVGLVFIRTVKYVLDSSKIIVLFIFFYLVL